jgi:uncharacterized protein YndB with AHSA1/START domain
MQQEPVVIEKTLQAPVSHVWKALTDAEAMRKWYFQMPEFKAAVGFEFSFVAENDDKKFMHLCMVTQVIPERKLSYSWRYEGYPGNSEVTFDLFPEGDTTRLRVTHTGLETFPRDEDFARANFQAGWTHIVGTSLTTYLGL